MSTSTCTPNCITVSDPMCGLRETITCSSTVASRPCTITCPYPLPLRQHSILRSACHSNWTGMLVGLATRWAWRRFHRCAPLQARPVQMATSCASEYRRRVWNKKWWMSCESLPMPRRVPFGGSPLSFSADECQNGCNTSECKTAAAAVEYLSLMLPLPNPPPYSCLFLFCSVFSVL